MELDEKLIEWPRVKWRLGEIGHRPQADLGVGSRGDPSPVGRYGQRVPPTVHGVAVAEKQMGLAIVRRSDADRPLLAFMSD